MNFNDKSVVILGGLGGLGKAICQELVRNGLKVSLTDLTYQLKQSSHIFIL